MKGGKYENIPSLVENLVEHAPVTISWLTGLGADLSDVGLMGGSSVKRTHLLKEGATVAELAKAIGIPAADLEATLNHYNA